MSYDILIDGIPSSSLNLLVTKRPDFPAPKKRYNEYDVLGRDGKLYQDTGHYDDIELSIEFNYMTAPDNWHDIWRKAKKWFLSSANKKLICSDDMGMYYMIKKVVIDTNARTSYRIGKFTVSFTLDPYTYLTSGLNKINNLSSLMNPFDVSKPIYFIQGEGICTLNINGHTIKANVAQNLIIDVFRELSYRTDGTLINYTVDGDYEDMVLIEGINNITISPSSFKLEIQPNWRCI